MSNWIIYIDMILSYGVSGYVLFRYLFALFKPKYKNKKYIYYFAYFIFVILAVEMNLLDITFLKGLYGVVSVCLIGVLLFDSSEKRRIIGAGLIFFLYMVVIDAFSVLVFTLFSGHTIENTMENSIYSFICGLINQVMLLCFYKPILNIIQRHKFDRIARQQNIFLVILAIFEIALLNYISIVVDTTASSMVLTFLSSGFLALDIYLVYLFEAISEKYSLENEMELRDQQLSMQNNYYHSIETQYDHSRRLIHDMKNHMQTLEELYSSGSGLEAKHYAQTILESMDAFSGRFKCKNRILTIIINDKILKCDEQDIEINTQVEDIDFDFIEPFDMTTIFSNLLDNAIEACSKISMKRRIDLKVYKFNEFITISVRNPYDGKLVWDKDSLASTKGGKHMGLGLKNVKSAVEKYEGTMQRKSDDEHFEVKILMSPESRTDI